MMTTDHDRLERVWGLVSLPMANEHYVQAVLAFLDDGAGGVCPRARLMFELAWELRLMRGTLEGLLAAWCRNLQRRRAVTAPMTPSALRGAALTHNHLHLQRCSMKNALRVQPAPSRGVQTHITGQMCSNSTNAVVTGRVAGRDGTSP